jgi:hypothetical protein
MVESEKKKNTGAKIGVIVGAIGIAIGATFPSEISFFPIITGIITMAISIFKLIGK